MHDNYVIYISMTSIMEYQYWVDEITQVHFCLKVSRFKGNSKLANQSAFLHFKKSKKILSTRSSLGKNNPNFVYPNLILNNRSHDNIHPRCMPRNYLRSIIQMTYVCTSLAEKVLIAQPAKEEATWGFSTLYYARYCKNISQKLHRIFLCK